MLRWTLYVVLYYYWILCLWIIPHQEKKQTTGKGNKKCAMHFLNHFMSTSTKWMQNLQSKNKMDANTSTQIILRDDVFLLTKVVTKFNHLG